MERIGYYFITDDKLSLKGNVSDIKQALALGVKFIQYRAKNKTTQEMFKEALILRRLCKKAFFLVNDRLDIALAVSADGVHLGQDDLPPDVARYILGKKKIIGVSVATMRQAVLAQKKGADYLGVGPVFATKTKLDAEKPLGLRLITRIKKHLKIPVVAIGGINLINASSIVAAKADGLCAISEVVTSARFKEKIHGFQALFNV
jgi:thiamine-phosphate pyrophosphorylase